MSYLYNRLILFKKPAFMCYTLTCLLATLGAGMSFIAIPWVILQHHNNIVAMAIAAALFWGPNVLLSPLGGVLADRYPRVLVMIASNVLRIFFLTLLAFFTESHLIASLYIVSIISGIGLSFYIPAAMAFVREIVNKKELLYANASVDMAYEIGNMGGMALGGILVSFLSISNVLLLNAGIFGLSSLLLCFLPKKVYRKELAEKPPILRFVKDMKQGLVYLYKNRELMMLYSIQCLMMLQYMVAPILLAPFAKNMLHTTSREFGYIEATLSVGVIVGGFWVPWLQERFGFYRTTQSLLFLLSSFYLWFAINRTIIWADIIYFLIGIAFGLWPLLVTRAQEATDLNFQGRVQSVFMCIVGICILLTYAILALTGLWLPLASLYWMQACLAIAIIVLLWIAKARNRNMHPKKTAF